MKTMRATDDGGCRRSWRTAAWLACWLAPLTAFGALFPDLYSVTVTPSNEVEDRRADGIRLAMGRLLTRVTGRPDARWQPEFTDLIEGAPQFVDAVGFETADRLTVTFNRGAVEEQLTRLDYPIWGAERPLTILWVAVDGAFGERGILPADDLGQEWSEPMTEVMDELREELLAVANERGLPVVLPLLDLQDINAVGFADLWGGFTDRVETASGRYGADAALIGRVRVSDFGRQAQWTLLQDGRRRPLGGGPLRYGLDRLAEYYASEFAAVGGLRTARITVLDIRSLDDYGSVMRYLENLSLLESVQVEELDGDSLTLRLAARGDGAVLERVLTLGGVLSPADDVAAGLQLGSGGVYRLARR